jgi:hypothetical protein
MFDDLYTIDELQSQLGPAQRGETQGAILRRGQPANVPATELVPGRVLTWPCGCRAGADDALADGTLFYTLEPCGRHRKLEPGKIHPCVALAELTGLTGKGLQLSNSPSAGSCRRALTRAMELGIANIPAIFDRPFDELSGTTLKELLANGAIDQVADGLQTIMENHPELRIVRIEE